MTALKAEGADAAARADALSAQLQAALDDVTTQRAVNQQLMLKKEEIEWQLMTELAARVRGGRQRPGGGCCCVRAAWVSSQPGSRAWDAAEVGAGMPWVELSWVNSVVGHAFPRVW